MALRQDSSPRKKQALMLLLLLAVAVAAIVWLRNCRTIQPPPAPTSQEIAKSGGDTLDIAIEYSPLCCYIYADTMGGFSYDLLRAYAAQTGQTVKFHKIVALEQALDALQQGEVQMLVAQYPVTKENKEKFLFSDQLYLDRQVLVQRKDSTGDISVKSTLDLARRTVTVVKGSPMRQRIESLSKEIGDTINVVEDDLYGPEQLFIMVATAEIDYAVINESVASKLSPKYPDVDTTTPVSFTQFQAVAFSKDDQELCTKFNQWLAEHKTTPQYRALYKRYF